MYCPSCGHKSPKKRPKSCEMCQATIPWQADASTSLDAAIGIVVPVKVSPYALLSYLVGFFSLLVWPLGFVAIILGILGIRQARRREYLHGRGRAVLGIVLGTVSATFTIIILVNLLLYMKTNGGL